MAQWTFEPSDPRTFRLFELLDPLELPEPLELPDPFDQPRFDPGRGARIVWS